MKKIFVALAFIGSVFCANAEESYAPKAGDVSTEIQFTPFADDGETFSMTALQGRFFLTDKDALLIELGLGGDNNKTSNTEVKNAYKSDYKGKFTLNLGYQNHFYNYKRVDLYAGAKVGLVHNFAAAKNQVDNNNWTWNNEGTGTGFSAYLITGIDFYIYKGLYLGAEINAGFEDVLAANTTTKVCFEGKETEEKTTNGGHNFKGGFNVNPKIRLGWTF